MKISKRDWAVAVVFGWAVLLVAAWIVAMMVAPDGGGPDCPDQGYMCSNDVELLLFIIGVAAGVPVLIGAEVVSLLIVLIVYWRKPHARHPVLIGTAIFWACVVAGIGVAWFGADIF